MRINGALLKHGSKFAINKTLGTLFMALLILGQAPSTGRAESVERVAVLPFEAHSMEDISYIGEGLVEMLGTRLTWKDHVEVADPAEIKKILLKTRIANLTQKDLIRRVAEQTRSHAVLKGSITELSGAFSLDIHVYEPQAGAVHTFFSQAGTVDEIIPQLNTLAGQINQEVFNRETRLLKKPTPTAVRKNIRANPETLIPEEFREKEEKKPFWQFW